MYILLHYLQTRVMVALYDIPRRSRHQLYVNMRSHHTDLTTRPLGLLAASRLLAQWNWKLFTKNQIAAVCEIVQSTLGSIKACDCLASTTNTFLEWAL